MNSHTVKRVALLASASIQVCLTVSAWADLIDRAPARIRGPKAGWAWIATVPFIGPSAYFIRGIRR